jgi:ferredoxin
MRVWIDQDLCTGDGLCTDHCPEVFVLLEDGISYVRSAEGAAAVPGGAACTVAVPPRREADVIAAALDCPGDCIFVEPDVDCGTQADDDIVMAEVVGGAGFGDGSFGPSSC